MVEFKIKIHPEQRVAYIPKEIVEVLGFQVKAVPNRAAVLLYPEGTALKDVARSVHIIKEDLEHAAELEKEASENEQH